MSTPKQFFWPLAQSHARAHQSEGRERAGGARESGAPGGGGDLADTIALAHHERSADLFINLQLALLLAQVTQIRPLPARLFTRVLLLLPGLFRRAVLLVLGLFRPCQCGSFVGLCSRLFCYRKALLRQLQS